MNTLAVQLYTSSLPRRVWDFHPLERAHGAQTKKKNGYTILNPVNGIFGLGHYPCLPTAQYYNINIKNKKTSVLQQKFARFTTLVLFGLCFH
jgi:hypothetical protein